jgi:signal transduction histidine kinase
MGVQDPGQFDIQQSLPHAVEAAGRARRLVAQLRGRCPDMVVSDAKLLNSEFATNAVKYGGAEGDVGVRIESADGDLVRFSVTCASGETTPQHRPLSAGGGLGLQLVDQLAHQWGTDRRDGRTTVWFTLPCSASPQSSARRSFRVKRRSGNQALRHPSGRYRV